MSTLLSPSFKQSFSVQIGSVDFSTSTGGSFSAYNQLISSSSSSCNRAIFSGTLINGVAAEALVIIQLARGAAGAEILLATSQVRISSLGSTVFLIDIDFSVAAGVRFSARGSSDGATGTTVTGTLNLCRS